MKKSIPLAYSQLLKQHIIRPYDKIVTTYAERHFVEPIFKPLLNDFIHQLPDNSLVLDAGCGPGGETAVLLQAGLRVVSVDVSSKMLNKAKELVPAGDFIEMNMAKLDFPANHFAGIWCARTLIHIPSQMMTEVLSGFWRVLQPGGLACLTVLTGNGESIEPEYYDPSNTTTTFFHHFRPGELEAELEQVGFQIEQVKKTYLGEEREEHYSVFAKKTDQ